jgi:competence protein ComEC
MWLGDALGRRWDRLAVLGWTGLALVAWRPSEAMSLGFLLSVGVTALLLFMGERERAGRWWLLERHKERTARKGPVGVLDWLGGWVWRALKLNAVCWLVSAPAIVAATGVVSPLAPLVTVAIVPLATALLGVGWLQALLGVMSPGMASRTVGIVDTMGSWMGGMARWFDGLPGSSAVVGGVGWVWAAAATVVILGLLFRPGQRRMYAALLAASLAYAVAANSTAGRVSGLRADMLDVGDGTAVIIRSGADTLLWDCGSLHRAVGQRVADAARELGVPRVREAVVTHANLDHFNALPEVADRLGLRRVFVSTALMNSRGGAWGQVRELLEARGVEIAGVAAGDEILVGSLRGEVLWPPAETGERWLGNDGSLVVRFRIDTPMGERALVMTGDIQAGGVAGLEARGVDVRAAVIEAPHHGSANDAGVSLVDRAGASAVLQSSGPGRVNLPAWAGVRARTAWLSTAEGGAIWARIRPDGRVEVGSYREAE